MLVQQTEPVPDRDRPSAPSSGTAGRGTQVAHLPQHRSHQPHGDACHTMLPSASPDGPRHRLHRCDSVTTLLETETRTVDYTPSRLPGFEISVGRERWPQP